MGRVLSAVGAAGGVVAAWLGVLGGTLAVALLAAGNVYKTDCVTSSGHHVRGWEFPMTDWPYLWKAGEGCEESTLTRVVLGEVGVMGEVR